MAIRLELLQEKARAATHEALQHCVPIPGHLREQLTLGTLFDGDERIFELYVAGERPQDAVVLTRVAANAVTGELGPVQVFEERWRPAS